MKTPLKTNPCSLAGFEAPGDTVGGSETTQIRQHNSLNEITSTKDGAQPKDDFLYDKNGNLLNDGVRKYEWDVLNRLKKVYKDPNTTPVLIGEYTYDALSRRVKKVVTNGGLDGTIPNGTTRFLYNSSRQCVEERDGSNSVTKQYVWGRYLRELIQLKTFTTINGNAAGEYYPLCDTLYRTLALTDDTGAIVEAYDYDAYGNTLIFTAAGTGGNWFADDATTGPNPTCNNLYTGQYFDPEITLYDFDMRYYAPTFGRFLSRDPLGYVDGMNPFRAYFVPNGLDPTGLVEIPKVDATGVLHGESIPNEVPSDWKRWQVQEALDEVEASLEERIARRERLGRDYVDPVTGQRHRERRPEQGQPTHRGRIKAEIDWKNKLRARLRTRTVTVLEAYMSARDVCQAMGLVQPDYTVVGTLPYYFPGGDSVFIVKAPGALNFWSAPQKEYISGPRKGAVCEITDKAVQRYREIGEQLYGRYVPGNLFREPRFIPGTERKSIPLIDDNGFIIGEVGKHGVTVFHQPYQ
jgi:RHS repeat-associated protein